MQKLYPLIKTSRTRGNHFVVSILAIRVKFWVFVHFQLLSCIYPTLTDFCNYGQLRLALNGTAQYFVAYSFRIIRLVAKAWFCSTLRVSLSLHSTENSALLGLLELLCDTSYRRILAIKTDHKKKNPFGFFFLWWALEDSNF